MHFISLAKTFDERHFTFFCEKVSTFSRFTPTPRNCHPPPRRPFPLPTETEISKVVSLKSSLSPLQKVENHNSARGLSSQVHILCESLPPRQDLFRSRAHCGIGKKSLAPRESRRLSLVKGIYPVDARRISLEKILPFLPFV